MRRFRVHTMAIASEAHFIGAKKIQTRNARSVTSFSQSQFVANLLFFIIFYFIQGLRLWLTDTQSQMDYKKKNSITVVDNRTGHQKEIFLPYDDQPFSTTWGDLNITVARSKVVDKKKGESLHIHKSDWVCSYCATTNFGSKSSEICFKCKRSKPEPPPELPYPSKEQYEYLLPSIKKVTGTWSHASGGLSTTILVGLYALPPTSWLIKNEVPKESIDVFKIVERFSNSVESVKKYSTKSSGSLEKELLAQVIQDILKITPFVFSYHEGGGVWNHSTTELYGFVLDSKLHFRLDFKESEYNVPGERDPSL
jgi:hypothetical protein